MTALNEGSGVPVIELLGVSKDYESDGGAVRALRDTTLTIALGEFVAIVGTSGSGKSTMMNILGCLDRPTRGVYRIVGFDAGARSADSRAMIRNRLIGFIFQGFNLLSRTTALENVELPLQYRGVPRRERRERALAALEAVGLGKRVKHRPNELSGGQQQRVAIARALVTNPPIILADEPTGNLDTRTSLEVLSFLQRLNRERRITIVLVTHEPDIAACAGRIITMRDGRIVSDEANDATDADVLLRALPPAAAPGAFGATLLLDSGQPKPLPKIPRSAYFAMALGALLGVAFGFGYDQLVLGQTAWWPLVLFGLVGECMMGERSVRRRLGPLHPLQAARVAIPYTIGAAAILGGASLINEAWWPTDAVARAAALSPAGIIGAAVLLIFAIAVLGVARSLLIAALSPTR